MIIGPFTPGPHADLHSIQILAEIGVAFLMFALGAELSFGELRRLGRVAILGGALQVLCTMGLGPRPTRRWPFCATSCHGHSSPYWPVRSPCR